MIKAYLRELAIKYLDIKQPEKVVEKIVNTQVNPWTNEHKQALKEFFESHVGKDLIQHLALCEMKANAWAMQGEDRIKMARGIQLAHANLLGMANVPEKVQSQEATDDEIEDALNNRINGYL